MKQTKTSLGLLLFAVLSVTVLAVSPASARHLSANAQVAATSSNQSMDDSMDMSTSGNDNADMTAEMHGNTKVNQHVTNLKAQAHQELAKMRQEKKTATTATQRQKLCENRKNAVDHKLKAFDGAADRSLTKLDSIYTKLKAYQTDKNVMVSNYAELTANADAKQMAATQAVAALQVVSVDIDCTSTDPASSLTVVKDAAHSTRQALQDYRKSLKDIVVALAQSKTTTDTTTTTTTGTTDSMGGNQ